RAGGGAGRGRHAGLLRPGRTGRRPGPARAAARPLGTTSLGTAAAATDRAARTDGERQEAQMTGAGLRSIVLAGGGTGGHIYPLLAFADCLRRHDPHVRITCLGTPRGLESEIIPGHGYDLRHIPAYQLPRTLN